MGRRTSDVRPAQERTFLRPAALRQKQWIRSIETVKADTARKNWSISIAFSRWREDRWMHDPPKSPTSATLYRPRPDRISEIHLNPDLAMWARHILSIRHLNQIAIAMLHFA